MSLACEDGTPSTVYLSCFCDVPGVCDVLIGAQSASVVGSLGASLLEVVWSGHPYGSFPEQCVWWLNM